MLLSFIAVTAVYGVRGPLPAEDTVVESDATIEQGGPLEYELMGPAGPHFSDIQQGLVGDCYFLATLAAIANTQPDAIRKLFISTGARSARGRTVYQLRFNLDGRDTEVAVDDAVPVLRSHSRLFGATPTWTEKLWPAILEKAFAKLFGTYHSISSGYAFEAFKAISQAPIHRVYFWFFRRKLTWVAPESGARGRSRGDLWSFLRSIQSMAWPMVADTPRHSFAVLELGAQIVNGDSVRAVRVFDTRQYNEYAGAIKDQPADQGDYWMTFDEFLSEFKVVRYTEIEDNARVVSRSVAPGLAVFRVTTRSAAQFSVHLEWPNGRLFSNGCESEVRTRMTVAPAKSLLTTGAKKAAKMTKDASFRELKVSQGPGEYLVFLSTSFGHLSSAVDQVSLVVRTHEDDSITLAQDTTSSFKSLCLKALGLKCIPLFHAARQRKQQEARAAEQAKEGDSEGGSCALHVKSALDRLTRLNNAEELLRGDEDSELPPQWSSMTSGDHFSEWKSSVTWASLSLAYSPLES